MVDCCVMVEELSVIVYFVEVGDFFDFEMFELVCSKGIDIEVEEIVVLFVFEGEVFFDREGKCFSDDNVFDVVIYC